MTERVAIADIVIRDRRRQDLGDIAALARNIDQHGLLHPIIIAADNELIAGERRLRACQHLGESTIDVRRLSDLSPKERRELELAENLDRKDLTAAERSRQMVALAEVAADLLRSRPNGNLIRRESGSRGPLPAPDGQRAVAERIGISQPTLSRARDHVAAIDTYPELTPYPQSDALKIANKLNEMPEDVRAETRAAVIAHDGATLAALTDRPPMPAGPSVREQVARDPAVRFQADLHDLWKRLNGVRDHGGIARVIAHWSTPQKLELLSETERIAELMHDWYADIKEQLA